MNTKKTGVPDLKDAYNDALQAVRERKAYAVKIPGLIRLAFVAILVIGIVFLNFLLANYISRYYIFFYSSLRIISVIFVLFIINRDRNPSFTMAWTILILVIPIAGLSIYFLWGRKSRYRKQKEAEEAAKAKLDPYIDPQHKNFEDFSKDYPEHKLQASLLRHHDFPIYRNTKCKYYSLGEYKFVDMFADLKKAKKFIFLEYFILADGMIWDQIEEIILQKVQEGVDVRLMFDDFGSIIKAPNDLINKLRSQGVKVYNFNPVARYISKLYANFRNHQKCCIIDGNIAYTGGTNLADEYANLHNRFGHWKDTAIRLEGDAVWGLTSMFLTLWISESKTVEQDYTAFMPTSYYENLIKQNIADPDSISDNSEKNQAEDNSGYFIPYWDSPLNSPENPAEDIYRSMINTARKQLFICTPYFIVDDSMVRDICRAAESGIDVRLITPGKPDKWFAYVVTQSHYQKLLNSGVRIFQYSPGFIHAKTVIADCSHVITGCINFDYRSFHLNYENSVYICGDQVVQDIYRDFEETFALSTEIDSHRWQKRNVFRKALETFMRVFSPLL